MALWKQLAETGIEKLAKDKEQRRLEEEYVKNNRGSKVISEYIAYLFEKGNVGYNWLKENRIPVYPVINKDSVSLCYMQPGDGKSFSGTIPKDVSVGTYTFEEIYKAYGLQPGEGYARLSTRTQLNALESMINTEISKHSHLKFNGGYLVRAFQ